MNTNLRVMCVGKIVAGEIDWTVAPLPMQEPPDGELLRLIDEGEQTAEYIDWLIDIEWIREGC